MKRYIFSLILLSFSLCGFAQFGPMKEVSDVAAVKDKMEANARQTKSIKANFTQEKHLNILEEVIRSKGSFLFKKENKVRWNYTHPYAYLIIINNGKIHINDEGKKKSYDTESSKMFAQINKIVIGTAKGTLFSDPDYSTRFLENEQYYQINLSPKNAKLRDYINEIHLLIDKKDLSVSQLKMIEKSGDFTLVRFIEKQLNLEVNDSEFTMP